ncbi:hypothetical protein [Desulfobacter postgatei]|uniref:hypothetical protein n=1 Tax=Desulfobacter postgatei TaxID=2293 RepID=UPI00259B5059|nr:hypothetical protein [uncultured Desulfobacter sp.]
MARKFGIPLVDLFAITDQINTALPQSIQDFIDRFSVIEHRTTRSPGAIFHHGKVQSLTSVLSDGAEEMDIGIGKLAIPLIHGGVPFQFSMARTTITNNLEPAAQSWQLDLALAEFALTLDGLEPAIYVAETGTTPRHLLRDDTRSSVRIIGSAVLRIEKPSPTANVEVKFIDKSDPLDPTLGSGVVAEINFSPPHFFLGKSEFGLSVGRLQFDFSDTYSPPNILEQNQGPSWVGLAIQEATVYAPRNLPLIGDLSGGVKNVLLGQPMGIQGEFELQFGRTALNPSTFQFQQDDDSLAIGGSGTSCTVGIEAGHEDEVTINAGFTTPAPPADGTLPPGALQDWSATWVWPDGTTQNGDSGSGRVSHGQVLRVTPVETVTVDGTPTTFNHPEITFRFVAQGTAPSVSASIGSESFDNLIHLNGTIADIATVTLTATSSASGTSEFEWEIPGKHTRETGTSFTPDFSGLEGQQWIILRERVDDEEKQRLTRIRVQLTETDSLLVGCEDGVFNASDDSTALSPAAVEATYDLSDFHGQGVFNTNLEQAVLDPSEDANVSVPPDALAQVTISSGGSPAVHEYDRHVQIEFVFEEAVVTKWGDHKPVRGRAAANETDLQSQLLEWASHFPGAEFIVIGRCDDIGRGPGEFPDPFNIDLALDRANKGKSLLTSLLSGASGAPIDSSRVFIRGESAVWTGSNASGNTLEENADIALTNAEKSEAVADAALMEGWLIKTEHTDHTTWVNEWDASKPYESIRKKYRRVDIYAVGGTPTDDAIIRTGIPEVAPTLRRSMIPADDRVPTAVPSSSPAIDYRVKLKIAWDSPTVSDWRDAIPTLAEAEFSWTPTEMPLPDAGGNATELSRETLTVFAKWVHDARTEFTRVNLGIRSDGDPDGLFSCDNKSLTAAAALGPMLLSGVDLENDVVGSGARIAALIAAAGFAEVDMGDGSLVGDGSKTAVIELEAEAQTRALSDPAEDYQIKLTTDYVCTLHINGGALGIKTAPDKPVKIRYKNVGIEFDNSADGWAKIGMAYETDAMEIVDAGKWQIDGVLGQLLRIVEISFGRGSMWVEGRIAIAISIGVVEISEAIIRLTWNDGSPLPNFELRGFVVKTNITEVLKGEGRLRIEDGGVIRAGVDASVIPLGLGASAGLAFGKPPSIDPHIFLELFLGVQFSTPLPLGQSGAAIYGFKGQFTMNGSRKLGSSPDPIKKELDWWAAPPGSKYEPDKGQYALGLGVVVGTMPDVSFAFSAAGMVVVAFSDPEVILGVDVKIIEVPDTTVSDEGSPSGTITGLIVIDDTAVKVAVSAQYTIPKVLELKVPFGAYFPYSGNGVYVRLGSDGQVAHGRFGEPITLKLLPGTLDAQAWAYLMIEQNGLPYLGGDERFSFEGFSIGFGAGWGIDWSAGPIKLSASAKVLVGFGTKPLLIKGGVFVAGELDLVVVSISARGELILTYFNDNVFLEGEFCGEVDLFFFSIKGCVGVSIGSENDSSNIPPPEPPVTGISLTDRRDRIMGEATTNGSGIQAQPIFAISDDGETGSNSGVSVSDNNTVWADTAPVLHFSHYVKNQMPATGQFDATATPTQPIWFGSNRLKYTYRLDNVTLRRKGGGALVSSDSGQLQAAWMTTPYRQPDSSGEDNPTPSEHEGPNLKLLDWNPWNWVVNMDNGGDGTDGDPAEGVEDLCDPVPQPRRACVFGRAARGAGWYAVRFRQETPAEPPYPSRFSLTGEPVLRLGGNKITDRDLMTIAVDLGASIVPGRIADLPFNVPFGPEMLQKGYRLPALRKAMAGGLVDIPMPWEGTFDRELSRPKVTLLVCDAPAQPDDRQSVCVDFDGVKPSGTFQTFTFKDLQFTSNDPNIPLRMVDAVDTSTEPDRHGQDQNPEIMFPARGMTVELPYSCTEVVLFFMKFTNSPITITALNAAGQPVSSKTADGPQRVPIKASLNAGSGIRTLRIIGGGGEAILYRICRAGFIEEAGENQPDNELNTKQCRNFAGLKLPRLGTNKFKHLDMQFQSIGNRNTLRMTDIVDDMAEPARAGRDREPEVRFGNDGIRITFAKPCRMVELKVMLFGGPLKAQALNSAGARVAEAKTPKRQRVEHSLQFKGSDIRTIEIFGGDNRAVVFEICSLGEVTRKQPEVPLTRRFTDFSHNLMAAPHAPADGTTAATAAANIPQLPAVSGIVNDEILKPWPGKVDFKQGRCQVITYEPEIDPEGGWHGFQIKSPQGKRVTVLAVCGIDQIMVDRRNEDAVNRTAMNDVVNTVLATAAEERREVLLEPGVEYEIQVDWSYQAWQANDDGTDEPPATPSGTWINGTRQTFFFAVAGEDKSTGNTQDGLNEYVFDARDINRHLVLVEPTDGRSVHFTGDPIWAHFDAGHIQYLLEQYGRELQIEVRRTDPPPQSNPADLIAALEPLIPLPGSPQWQTGPVSLMPVGYQRINKAVNDAPCLPEGPAVGGASLSAQFDLEPDAMYDLRILAPKTDGAEPAVVSATRFITSRYDGPEAFMESLGFSIGTQSPYRIDDIILPASATLPSGSLEASDALLDDLLREMEADTLPLPRTQSETYAVWRQVSGSWQLEGLLIDSLESLNRTGAVQRGDGSEITTRCIVSTARIQGHTMTVIRATKNWTRVFLKPASPIHLTGVQLELALDFETSDGPITGKCTLNEVPAIVDREGL